MKCIKWLSVLFVFVSIVMCANELSEELEVSVGAIEKTYNKVIDDLFAQAQASLEEKKDIITSEWLTRKEMEEVKYLMSDVYLAFCFDHHATNAVAQKLQDLLQIKICNSIEKGFEKDEATIEGLRQFLYLSETVCKISQGNDCSGMMRAIKDDSFAIRQNLKSKKKMYQQVQKEEMRRLCEIVALGAQPRR